MPRTVLAGSKGRALLTECPGALLDFFSTPEACALRLVSREFQAAVAAHPWEDRETVIQGSIGAWRASFPQARCANVCKTTWGGVGGTVTRRAPVVDADFVHFEGLWELDMSGCTAVTDAAFVHLRGIRLLNMRECNQPAITGAAFAHQVGIQKLCILSCNQATLTDAAFIHLRGIQVLNMSSCMQLTDAAFAHLKGIHTLFMWGCMQPSITDAAFAHLRGIHSLVMEFCNQATITEAGLAHLVGITKLGMHNCNEELIKAAERLGLRYTKRQDKCYGAFHSFFDEDD
jgi:hypothetical protein